jgi:hypothetical protein
LLGLFFGRAAAAIARHPVKDIGPLIKHPRSHFVEWARIAGQPVLVRLAFGNPGHLAEFVNTNEFVAVQCPGFLELLNESFEGGDLR